MLERLIFGALLALVVAAWGPTSAIAQTNDSEAIPRLTLPVAPEDYPFSSFVADEEGHAVLIATIGIDGQMSNARLESSSGYATLDQAAIELANEAHLSIPPTNAAGEPVSTDVLVDVIWELPEETPRRDRIETSEPSPNGLIEVASSAFALAYFRPGVDFGGYHKFIVQEPKVAFKDGWRRQHSKARLSDMQRITQEMVEWFHDEFVMGLQIQGHYQQVEEAGDDILLIRAGIAELDVAAPILPSNTSPRRSYSEEGTTATLVLELVDSNNGEILARLFDRQRAASANFGAQTTRYSNEADARKIFALWAGNLHERLEEDRE